MRLNRRLLLFLVLVLTAGIMGLQRRAVAPAGQLGREGLATVTHPLAWVTTRLRNVVGGASRWVDDLLTLRQDNVELRRELATLRRELRLRDEDRLENERLRRLLDLPAPRNMREMAARVIGSDPTNWFRTIRIDKGSRDGVLTDSPVIAEGGVVGHVIEVTAREATVLLLLDANCRVAAIVQDSRAQGLIEGQYESPLRLTYVDRNERLREGDAILTSGMGGIYPKGLLVGHVTRITPQENGLFLLASVRPAVDFARLEHVLVLLPPFSETDPAVGDLATS